MWLKVKVSKAKALIKQQTDPSVLMDCWVFYIVAGENEANIYNFNLYQSKMHHVS